MFLIIAVMASLGMLLSIGWIQRLFPFESILAAGLAMASMVGLLAAGALG